MGIKFYCQACDRKLNVKSFLAGKRGVCPHCSARVDIPLESQIPSKKDRRTEQPADAPQANPTVSTPTPAAVEHVAVGTAVAPAAPTPAPVATAAPVAEPVQPAVAAATQTADPIAEAPNAIWYVRPPSGGQYGPAKGDVFRKWIGEGRVSADSLVWREGWEDWQTAAQILPEFSDAASGNSAIQPAHGTAIPSPVNSTPALPSTSSRPPSSRAAKRRPKNNSLAIAVVVVLVVMSFSLLGILFWVLSSK